MDNMMAGLEDIMRGWLYVGFVTSLALALYFGTCLMVGMARGKFGVKAPATTGNADFERYFRVQMNTLEQIVIFLPSLWMFAAVSGRPKLAALFGLVWVAGRALYAKDYYQAAERRGKGFVISMLATVILLLGSLLGFLYKIL